MHDLIRRTLEWMRLLLAPGTGKRRRIHRQRPRLCLHFTAVRHEPGPAASQLPLHRSPYGLGGSLDGADSVLVRPYLAAHDRESALQQRRRLALVLAADFGIDLDGHLIGAQEVAA
ncbi:MULTISPECIES: hypothetical protein [unclassified Streptomyces]|uniref:hypothetical protein n=1 Tax=unclassified Streptomyces TaxID=2593676 RepID=UPI00070A0F40|nr:hypothetical protein [Streptomyces sp. Root264]KRD21120.1 hypothetical protein ASE41_14150 [Streptomyces sp. Root264]